MKLRPLATVAFALAACITAAAPAVAQEGSISFRAAPLTDGYPEQAAFAVEQYNFDSLRQARLRTGIDGLEIFIGPVKQQGKTLAWVTALREDTLNVFQYGHPLPSDSAATLTLTLDWGETKLPVEVRHLPESDVILYRWPRQAASAQNAAAPQAVEQPIQKGEPFPPLKVATQSDQTFALATLADGQPAVVNWWHSACAPCLAEIPGFNELADRYESRVSFIAVTDDSREAVRALLEERPFTFKQTFVESETGRPMFGRGYPTTVILDADGKVARVINGGSADTASKEVEPTLERLLSEQ